MINVDEIDTCTDKSDSISLETISLHSSESYQDVFDSYQDVLESYQDVLESYHYIHLLNSCNTESYLCFGILGLTILLFSLCIYIIFIELIVGYNIF